MVDKIYIGYKNKNPRGYEYEVIEKLQGRKWKVKFINTGFEATPDAKEIRNGNVRDWKAPYVCGIGVVGTEIEHPQSHYLYDRWRDMLRRCYDPKNKMYLTYGAVGCYVVDDWHYFPNFVRDLEQKENIDKIKFKGKEVWQLDKDYICNEKGIEPHYYSNETTCIITQKENTKERNERQGNPAKNKVIKVMQFDTEGNYIKTWDSLVEASKSLHKEESINTGWMVACCQGKAYTYLGYCWIYEKDFISFEKTKEDILNKKSNLSKKDIKYRKIVQQFDLDGNLLKEWLTEDLAKELGIGIGSVSNAIARKGLCKGYKLQYKEAI
jgi:hypothetical protein